MHYTDPDARLDVEALTEMFDNEHYSKVGTIGRLVYELLLEILFSPQTALELRDRVKHDAFRLAHEWSLDGTDAQEEIRKTARETAKKEIFTATSLEIKVQSDTDLSLWTEAIAESGLDLVEKKVVLLSTANLIYDQGQNEQRPPDANETDDPKIARPLEPKEIAEALGKNEDEVKKIMDNAAEKMKAYLSKQILIGGN